MAAEDCSKVALKLTEKSKSVCKGPGNDESVCPLHNGGIEVGEIIDVTQCLTTDVVLQKT
jgi:hypothetical protein